MFQEIATFFKRFAVLIPGVVIAYFSVRNIFPVFDQRLPLSLAILATYALTAYMLIPAAIRLFRIVKPADHLPLYCVTPDGFASDPINIGIVGTRREIINAMQTAGWHLADPKSFRNVIKQGLSAILSQTYSSAPVSSLYLFGRKQDLAFEIPISEGIASRHHVRFWATTYKKEKRLTVRSIHWHNRKSHVQGDNLLWVGAASLDVGLAPIRHNFQITHMIDPDTDQERELIVSQLKKSGLVQSTEQVRLGQPYKLANRALHGQLHTDGNMTVVYFKKLPKI